MRSSNAHCNMPACAHFENVAMPRRQTRTAIAKRATNVSIRKDLLEAARGAGINLSATLERALTDELAAARRLQWRAENREAIQAYNEHIERHGSFSDGVRKF